MTGSAASAALPLGECDREPITRLEHIQAFGFLLAVSKDWIVTRASANLGALLGIDARGTIGKSLATLIDAEVLHDIRNRLIVLRAHRGTERLYGVPLLGDERLFDLAVHVSADLFVLEGERSGASEGPDTASLVRSMVGRLNTKTTIAALHRDCARQVRALLGFSRVMIYCFDESGAGEVIAESINGPLPSYEGLHYPASDIPTQARALYLRNPFRIIGDVDGAPVPLLPAAMGEIPVLDLTLAVTRAVAPVHIEYLRNMGVAASSSISIIVDGKLWGLIACHHETARVPAFARRSASELFTQMYAMILESRLHQADSDCDRNTRGEVNRMIGSIAADRRLLQNAGWLHDTLREIVECDGVVVFMDGRLASSGDTPTPEALAAIVEEMGTRSAKVFSTDRLAPRFTQSHLGDARVAGMLLIPMLAGSDSAVMLFRRARTAQKFWGGDPGQKDAAGDVPGRLSPRLSFDAFTIETRDRSSPFTIGDRRAAEMIRNALVEIVARIKPVDMQDHDPSDRHQMLIAELNHRVRNILSLIRGLINQTDSTKGSVEEYVRSLNGRVQALARAHDQVTRQHWGPGLLSTLFEHEVDAYVPTQLERFRLVGPAIHLMPDAFSTMALVIHELFTNSLKYGALSDAGRVEVTVAMRHGEGLHLTWRDIDGPEVTMPTRRGFGSAIIERTVPFDLQGTVDVRYPPGGLEVDLFVPERFVWTGDIGSFDVDAIVSPLPVRGARPLDGLAVMLVEDNMIVALQTEDLLRELGARQVVAASTVAAAADFLERARIDFVVLDIHVGSTSSLGFALVCIDRAIPFIFASGYGNDVELGHDLRMVPIVNKPLSIDEVGRAVEMVLALPRRHIEFPFEPAQGPPQILH